MDFLKEEILKKKRKLEDLKVLENGKKYFKRDDMARKEKEEYLNKQKIKDDKNKAAGLKTEISVVEQTPVEDISALSLNEVIFRLRELRQPIRLFGESDRQLKQRLDNLELEDPEAKGLRNDFQAAMEKVDAAYIDEWMAKERGACSSEQSRKLDVETKDAFMSDEEKARVRDQIANRELEENEQMAVVLRFFKYVLSLWGQKLNNRSSDDKQSARGRMESAKYTQTVSYIMPLFKKLKQKNIGVDVVDSLAKIVQYLLEFNYIEANAAYMELAIGNSPWPLGVTNHGIHSRPAQAAIHAKNIAHVLNDETQRKYIQSLKRLISLTQDFFPTDPHRCVNYMGPNMPSYQL